MKRPLLFGFAALCVLSTPNLLEEKYTVKEVTYRTIASQELRPDNRPDKAPEGDKQRETKGQRPPHPRGETPPVDKEVSEDKTKDEVKEESKEELVTENSQEENKEKTKKDSKDEKKVSKEEIMPEKDITVCEYRDEIAELRKQISDLLEDKEEVIAEVDKKDSKKKKDNKKDKEERDDSKEEKEERVAKIPSRYQQILSMGMFFGQGFQPSFQMPMMRFGVKTFLNTQPMFKFNNSQSFGLNQDNSWMTSGVLEMMKVGQPEQARSQSLRMSNETFIPTFTRTSVKAEGFTIK